jgi:hypothetical protein
MAHPANALALKSTSSPEAATMICVLHMDAVKFCLFKFFCHAQTLHAFQKTASF